MHVTLPPQLEGLVRRKLESGLYSGPDEVVGEALRLLAARDELAEARLQRLRTALVEGEASGFIDGFAIDDLLDELDGEAVGETGVAFAFVMAGPEPAIQDHAEA